MKLRDIIGDLGDIELDDDMIKRLRELGKDPKELIIDIFTSPLYGPVVVDERRRCDLCGKLDPQLDPNYCKWNDPDLYCECHKKLWEFLRANPHETQEERESLVSSFWEVRREELGVPDEDCPPQ